MNTHGLSPSQIAGAIGRSVQTVHNWSLKPDSRPVYLDLALRAIRAGKQPLPPDRMDTLDLVTLLGIPAGTQRYWCATTYPKQACLAAAWATRLPSPYHLRVLRNIDTAQVYHYTAQGVWRARGRTLPTITQRTMRALETSGHVQVAGTTARLSTLAKELI